MSKLVKKLIITLITGSALIFSIYYFYQSDFVLRVNSYLIRKNILQSTKPVSSNIKTNYYDFKMIPYAVDADGFRASAKYGGIESINDNLIYIDGDGNFLRLEQEKFKYIEKIKINNHKNEFLKDYKNDFIGLYFGIKDILVIEKNNQKTIYISTVDYNSANECYYLSVYSNELEVIETKIKTQEWRKVFNTKPCLPRHSKGIFLGQSAGGRLVTDNEKNYIFLSTGDFYFDGVNEKNILLDKQTDYGKLIKISISKAEMPKVIAEGFRNPQGLFYFKNGIYISNHGPQGGDNINFVELDQKKKRVQNFGWPLATLGVDYGASEWPLDRKNNNYKNLNINLPLFSWTPDIGISNLIKIEQNEKIIKWKDALLVGSLKDKALYLMQLENNRVYAVEKINIGIRVRDIIQIRNEFFLLEDGEKPVIWKLSVE